MIDRTGQLWDYRPVEGVSWARILILRSSNERVFPNAGVFHRVVYCDNNRTGDLLENLDHDEHNRWENRPKFFKRIV
jgi:hypothetical protein